MLQISPPAFDSVPDASSPDETVPFHATGFRISTFGFGCRRTAGVDAGRHAPSSAFAHPRKFPNNA